MLVPSGRRSLAPQAVPRIDPVAVDVEVGAAQRQLHLELAHVRTRHMGKGVLRKDVQLNKGTLS